MRHGSHGEINFFEINGIPAGAKRVDAKDYFVVGESETHGNDHRVAIKEDTEIYEKDGVLYVKNSSDTEVYCPKKERHDTITLPPSIWEVSPAKEYDYLNQEKRNVRD